MKTRKSLLSSVVVLMVAVLVVSCAKKSPYVAKENEEIYRTWINTGYSLNMGIGGKTRMSVYAQKIIIKPDGTCEVYGSSIDNIPQFAYQYTMTDKWIDSDGNIWYKTISKYKTEYQEQTRYELNKLGNSGRTWEYVGSVDNHPAKIKPNNSDYHIYYRQEE